MLFGSITHQHNYPFGNANINGGEMLTGNAVKPTRTFYWDNKTMSNERRQFSHRKYG